MDERRKRRFFEKVGNLQSNRRVRHDHDTAYDVYDRAKRGNPASKYHAEEMIREMPPVESLDTNQAKVFNKFKKVSFVERD